MEVVLSMESSGEEYLELVGSNDHHHQNNNIKNIITTATATTKRKRTKRPRPPSPAVTSASSSGGGTDQFSIPSTISFSSSTEDDDDDDHFFDEEQDMAKCLILLAQGDSRKIIKKNLNIVIDTTYECKTCNRRFPSFQALGGHRASHKKPKPPSAAAAAEEEEEHKKSPPPQTAAVEEGGKHRKIAALNSLSLHFGGNNNNKSSSSSSIATNKVHECSICGLEFSSGQALGGHMRRHRATTNATAAVDEKPPLPPPRSILSLDLNLPAPPEDDHIMRSDLTLHHFATTTPTLVHCHY